jgi:hypothetical protein
MQDLFTSKAFWTLVVGLAVMVAGATWPGFTLEQEQAAGLLVLLSGYLISLALDPGPGSLVSLLSSRKFWAALVGLAFVLLPALGIQQPLFSESQVAEVCVLIASYILSVALGRPVTPGRAARLEGASDFTESGR